ncbi:hypothetical protein QL285_083482 [Trifolium repens]|nr:hypothetical protein QL285_083482 [Trifolium repens]
MLKLTYWNINFYVVATFWPHMMLIYLPVSVWYEGKKDVERKLQKSMNELRLTLVPGTSTVIKYGMFRKFNVRVR